MTRWHGSIGMWLVLAAVAGCSDGTKSGDGGGGTNGGGGGGGTTGSGGGCAEAGETGCAAGGPACCSGLMCCAGVPAPDNGACYATTTCPISDRAQKTGIAPVDSEKVLDTVAALPISTWSYRFEPGAVRHMGPMAQDFHAAFGLGANDKSIHVIDSGGVSLASIQALAARTKELGKSNESLRRENQRLRHELVLLERRLDQLEQRGRR
jgi:hypothetical protein